MYIKLSTPLLLINDNFILEEEQILIWIVSIVNEMNELIGDVIPYK